MLRKGWPESSAERVSGVSLPLQHRLWQEFSATHPAGSSLSRLTLNTAGMCSFSLYLFTGSHTDTHTHLRFLHLPTLPHSLTSPMSLSHSHVPVLSLKAGLFCFLNSSPLTGPQVWFWLCHIGRQRQTKPGRWRYHSDGFRRAAKRPSNGATLVS